MRPATIKNFDCSGPYAIIKFNVEFDGEPENIGFAFQPDADAEERIRALNEQLSSINVEPLTDEQLRPVREAVKALHTKKVKAAVTASKRIHEELLDIDHLRLSGKAEDLAEYAKKKDIADKARADLIRTVYQVRTES